ncbi:hypothetical protein [Kitasatospora sp. NPDC002040]|uniref:hypothetical protein n=1 Tax=Kitasatospora sp. NPDC002040 TaxID=3154661 RepID=UPI0033318467
MGTAALVREARRVGTTVARLRELGAGEPEVARAVAGRIGLTAALAEELAVRWAGDHAGIGVLRTLAAQPATGPEWLALFAVHPDEQVRRAVAAHRATPKPTVRALAADSAATVRRAVAARERVPRRVVPALLDDPAAEVRLAMARRPGADPTQLRVLAADPDPEVRAAAAAHRHTPGEALLTLAGDPDLLVLAALAGNRFTPEPALGALTEAACRGLAGRGLAGRTEPGSSDPGQLPRQIVDSLLENGRLPTPLLELFAATEDRGLAARAALLLKARAERAGTEHPC